MSREGGLAIVLMFAIAIGYWLVVEAPANARTQHQVSMVATPTVFERQIVEVVSAEELYYQMLHDWCILDKGQNETEWCDFVTRYALREDWYNKGPYGRDFNP